MHSQKGRGTGDHGRQAKKKGISLAEIPGYKENIILGRSAGASIVLSVLCDSDTRNIVTCGTQPANLSFRTEVSVFKKGEPREILLEKLEPDTTIFTPWRNCAVLSIRVAK